VPITRRDLLASGTASIALAAAAPALALPAETAGALPPALLRRALDALELHRVAIAARDVIGIADFAQPSRAPRFHLVDLAGGKVTSHLVAHGRGSDPARTGWLQNFSNAHASHATSAGAYRTEAHYSGEHGPAIRLSGLDASNCNALARAIVVHAAAYVSEDIARKSGMLGRSHGCFVFARASL